MTQLAGANRRAPNPHPISVNVKHLFRHAHDDSDRSAGRNLGFPDVVTAVLTPTGAGTVVEEGKRKIEVAGKDYCSKQPSARTSLWCRQCSPITSGT